MGAELSVDSFGITKEDALENLNSKLARKYGGKIERDRKTGNLFVAANGSAHYVKIKKVVGGFKAYIIL